MGRTRSHRPHELDEQAQPHLLQGARFLGVGIVSFETGPDWLTPWFSPVLADADGQVHDVEGGPAATGRDVGTSS